MFKKILVFLLVLFLLTNFNLLLGKTNQTSTWKVFQHDLQRTGVADEEITPPLKEVWETRIGTKNYDYWIYSSPVIEEDKVYVGSIDKNLYCIDLNNGSILYKVSLENEILWYPVIGEKNIYVVDDSNNLYAISKEKKSIVWKKKIDFKWRNPPLFVNNKIYIASKNSILGFDEDGNEILNIKIINDAYEVFANSGMSYYNNYLYIYSRTIDWPGDKSKFKSNVYCIDPENKKIVWKNSWGMRVWEWGVYIRWTFLPYSHLVISNDKILLLSANGNLYKYKYDNGDKNYIKLFSVGDYYLGIFATPPVDNNIIYLTISNVTSIPSQIVAYDFVNDKEIWKRLFEYNLYASPIISGNYLYVPVSALKDSKPELIVLDKKTGDIIWKWKGEEDGIQLSSLAVANDKILFVTTDYYLRCFETESDFIPSISSDTINLETNKETTFEVEIKTKGGYNKTIKPTFTLPEGFNISIQPNELSGDGKFTFILSCDKKTKEGNYDLLIKFESENRVKELKLKINVIDKTPPEIKLISNIFNENINYVNFKDIKLNFDISDNQTQVDKIKVSYLINNMNEKEVTNNTIEISELEEGEHIITIRAVDEKGNENSLNIKFVVDLTPPTADINYQNYVNTDTIIIKGVVKDNLSGVNKVILNEEEVVINENGEFEKELKLENEENKFKVKVFDKANNFNEYEISIIKDTKLPVILFYPPSEVYDPVININGTVNDEGLSGIKDNLIYINGVKINLVDSKFSYTLNLNEGLNNIKIEIEDNAGNKLIKEYQIRYIKRITLKLQIGNKIMYVNDSPQEIDVPPQIVEGRTYLPIKYIVEPLGGEISWDGTEKKVTITLKDTTIELWIGKNIARVNGLYTPIDSNNPKVVPMIIQGRTMLPVRFVAENLGCDVQWDSTTKTITIIYPKI